jgi:hypothetical protein
MLDICHTVSKTLPIFRTNCGTDGYVIITMLLYSILNI